MKKTIVNVSSAVIAASLLSSASFAEDLTASVVNLGIPNEGRYPAKHYARNVWDLKVFEGRLYIGSGNSANEGPETNSGPVDIVSYDPETGTYTNELTVLEEQIDVFRILSDDGLYIPGHDPRGGGGLFLRAKNASGANVWQEFKNLTDIEHCYDVTMFDGKLVASGNQIWISSDASAANLAKFGDYNITGRRYSMFVFPNAMYAVGTATVGGANTFGIDRLVKGGSFQEVNNAGTTLIAKANRNYVFPDFGETVDQDGLIAKHPVSFGERVVYIGGFAHNDHQMLPVAAYCATDGDSYFTATKIALPEGAVPWDTMLHNGKVYLLWTTKNDSKFVNHVSESADGSVFTELFSFKADTFARSFEYHGGNFYFGLGAENVDIFNPHSAADNSLLSAASGTILSCPYSLGEEPVDPPEEPEEPVSPTIDPFAAETLTNCVYQVGENDRVYFFAEVGEHSFTVPSGFNATAEVLVVGGGGAGGGIGGGGGGGGGVVYNAAVTLVAGQSYQVVVGAGGVAAANKWGGGDGGTSSFGDLFVAPGGGGGGGGWSANAGHDGANGGGAGGNSREVFAGGSPTVPGGHAGGSNAGAEITKAWRDFGGGGGGAGGDGQAITNDLHDAFTTGTAQCGGVGLVFDITGSDMMYAYGGGGGGDGSMHGYSGAGVDCPYGVGAGTTDATSGQNGTGSGGGGSYFNSTAAPGGDGGSGVVVIRLSTSGEEPVDPPVVEHTHVWGAWVTNAAPNCTATGLRTRTCTAEGCTTPAAKEEEVLAALGHIEVIDPAVPATTTSTGLTEGKHCSRCGAVLIAQQIIPMLDPEEPVDPPYNPPVNPPVEGDEWFKVIFTNEGRTDIGGVWQGPKEGTASQSVTNGASAYVLKNVLNLDFVANTGSPDNADIVVEGKAIVSLSSNFPMVASDTVAGLCFKTGPKAYGYGANGWQELSGATPTVGAWVNYQALVSPTNGVVTYYINGTMLSPSLPLKSGTECITYVRYGGSGAVSDVRGYVALASSDPGTVVLETPTLCADGGFICADGKMTLTLDSPVVGAYYTLFTTESLEEPFVAQPGSKQCTSPEQLIQFVLDTTDAPAKFAMVVTSLQEIAEGTPLK